MTRTDLGHDHEEPAHEAPVKIDADSPSRFINRELSFLDYIARVLALAEDDAQPLLERAKFLAIFAEHLDEFFQVRVANLKGQVEAGLTPLSQDGMTLAEQLKEIRVRVGDLVERQSVAFVHDVVPDLADVGIILSDWDTIDDDDRVYLEKVFEERIFPVLTPLAVDPGHPFPYISNLSLNLAIYVVDPTTGERRFARLKVPSSLPRFIVTPDGERFVPLEQVIAAQLGTLFPGMEIESHYPFRVTRNADITLEEEEADDLLAAIEVELMRRRRFGHAVRLEVDTRMSAEVRDLLMRELDLGPDDVYVAEGPLQLSGLWAVHGVDRPELKDDLWVGVTQPRLVDPEGEAVDLLAAIRDTDILVQHPYDSFATSVEAFIEQAASDPHVLAIKQTLYRTSGDSPIVKALIRAAERGKQVAALVELKARFDEEANITWARQLEEAGVHVVYGLVGLKTHTKTALVVRDEPDCIRRYCHIGTGNYNSKTARIYEDVGLLSADPDLGADLTDLFNYLTGYSRQVEYRKLWVAPVSLRSRILALIEAEAAKGDRGRIVLKFNNLVDAAVVDALYKASQAGVEIDLIVRSTCCLRPGVPGLSDNIRVRSLVGRFLEHSRIFAFGTRDDRRYFIGSADLMPRNLDRRVEAVTPVDRPELQDRLQEVLDIVLADDTLAWRLHGDGSWEKVPIKEGVNAQVRLQELAYERARRRRSADTARG